jgi:hypothetical protein
MIYMWFTDTNYYKLAVEKGRDSIFTIITTIWKPNYNKKFKTLCLKMLPWQNSPRLRGRARRW